MGRIGATITMVLLAALIAAGPGARRADAHAAYKESDPPHRSNVSSPPSSVWAEFTEPVQNGARLDIFDPCGTRVDNGDATASAYRVTTSMSADKAGTYRVAFRVVSSLDGHPTSGEFTFTSTGGAPCETDEGAEPEGAARSDGEDADPVPVAGDDPAADPGPADAAAPAAESGATKRTRSKRERPAAPEGPSTELVAAQEGSPAAPAGDIPLDRLLVGFGLAAAIGAVGGQIYASIVGPVRRRRR